MGSSNICFSGVGVLWDEANMPCVSSPATNPSPGLWGWECSAKKLMGFGARLSSQGLIRADAWGKLVHSADHQLQNESLAPQGLCFTEAECLRSLRQLYEKCQRMGAFKSHLNSNMHLSQWTWGIEGCYGLGCLYLKSVSLRTQDSSLGLFVQHAPVAWRPGGSCTFSARCLEMDIWNLSWGRTTGWQEGFSAHGK